MSNTKSRRRLAQWARYVQRYPESYPPLPFVFPPGMYRAALHWRIGYRRARRAMRPWSGWYRNSSQIKAQTWHDRSCTGPCWCHCAACRDGNPWVPEAKRGERR